MIFIMCHLPVAYPSQKKLIAKAYLKKALQSDVVITISHFSKNEILNHFKVNPQKIHVIHNGVDVKKISEKPLASR